MVRRTLTMNDARRNNAYSKQCNMSEQLNGAAADDENAVNILTYEEAMRELEEIVTALENGNVPLGESLHLVQRGRELSQACAKMLSDAELTLSQLAATPEGELVEEPLDWDGDDDEAED